MDGNDSGRVVGSLLLVAFANTQAEAVEICADDLDVFKVEAARFSLAVTCMAARLMRGTAALCNHTDVMLCIA